MKKDRFLWISVTLLCVLAMLGCSCQNRQEPGPVILPGETSGSTAAPIEDEIGLPQTTAPFDYEQGELPADSSFEQTDATATPQQGGTEEQPTPTEAPTSVVTQKPNATPTAATATPSPTSTAVPTTPEVTAPWSGEEAELPEDDLTDP